MKKSFILLSTICLLSSTLLGMQGNIPSIARKRTFEQITPAPTQKMSSTPSRNSHTISSWETALPGILPTSRVPHNPSLPVTPTLNTRPLNTSTYQPSAPLVQSSSTPVPYSPSHYSQYTPHATQAFSSSVPTSPAPYTPSAQPRSSVIPPLRMAPPHSFARPSSGPAIPSNTSAHRSVPSASVQAGLTNSQTYSSTTSITPSHSQVKTIAQAYAAYNKATSLSKVTKIIPCACGEEFSDIKEIFDHIQKHIGYDDQGKLCLTCPICSENFEETVKFQQHAKAHNYNITYECNICRASFADQHEAQEHAQAPHSKKPRRDDSTSSAAPTSEISTSQLERLISSLSQRAKQDTQDTIILLSNEEEEENEIEVLETGVAPIKSAGKLIYSQPLILDTWELEAKKNVIAHHARSCPCTSVFFKSYDDLKKHVHNNHFQADTYECYSCSKKFGEINQLIFHGLKHKKHVWIKCSYCDAIFNSLNKAVTHLSTHSK